MKGQKCPHCGFVEKTTTKYKSCLMCGEEFSENNWPEWPEEVEIIDWEKEFNTKIEEK